MTIRKFKKEDTDRVISIWYEASLQNHAFLSSEILLKQKEEVLSKYLPMAETFVALEEGELIGFISMLEKYIGGLFVSPDWQGKGVGKSLVEKMIMDRGSLSVGVFEKNHSARKFYEKMGFKYINKELHSETNEYVLNMVLNI